MALVLPAVLSGAVMVFVDKFKYSPTLFVIRCAW